MEIKGYTYYSKLENGYEVLTYKLKKIENKYIWEFDKTKLENELDDEYYIGFPVHYSNLKSGLTLPFRRLHLNRKLSLLIIIPECLITFSIIIFKIVCLYFFHTLLKLININYKIS